MERNELLQKNNVLTDGLERRYFIHTFDRRLDMENVTPVELILLTKHGWGSSSEIETSNPDVYRFKCSAWTELLTNLVAFLQGKCPKSKEELLNFDVDWTSVKVFRETKDIVNMVQLDNGLYFSLNHSAAHSQWLIQELIEFYGAYNSILVIHRPPFSEPKEVTDFVKEERISEFKQFLINNKNVDEEKADKIVNAINGPFNKVMNKMSHTSYNDFFLFDNCTILSNMKSKLLANLMYITDWSEKQVATAKKYLDYLTDYYTVLKKRASSNKEDLEYQMLII